MFFLRPCLNQFVLFLSKKLRILEALWEFLKTILFFTSYVLHGTVIWVYDLSLCVCGLFVFNIEADSLIMNIGMVGEK